MDPKQNAVDSTALKNRATGNEQFAKKDIDEWIFSLFTIAPSNKILDLCSGRGKQTFKLAEKASDGMVYALDITLESLEEIRKQNKKNITTLLMDLDSFSHAPMQENYFDIIHCSYGLYYAKDAAEVIRQCHRCLKPGGIFVVVGPTDNNNAEIYAILEKFYPIDPYVMYTSRDFMNTLVVPESTALFSSVKKDYFTNEIHYPSADALLTYLQSSTMFKKDFQEQIKNAVETHFKENADFTMTKKAMGLVAIK